MISNTDNSQLEFLSSDQQLTQFPTQNSTDLNLLTENIHSPFLYMPLDAIDSSQLQSSQFGEGASSQNHSFSDFSGDINFNTQDLNANELPYQRWKDETFNQMQMKILSQLQSLHEDSQLYVKDRTSMIHQLFMSLHDNLNELEMNIMKQEQNSWNIASERITSSAINLQISPPPDLWEINKYNNQNIQQKDVQMNEKENNLQSQSCSQQQNEISNSEQNQNQALVDASILCYIKKETFFNPLESITSFIKDRMNTICSFDQHRQNPNINFQQSQQTNYDQFSPEQISSQSQTDLSKVPRNCSVANIQTSDELMYNSQPIESSSASTSTDNSTFASSSTDTDDFVQQTTTTSSSQTHMAIDVSTGTSSPVKNSQSQTKQMANAATSTFNSLSNSNANNNKSQIQKTTSSQHTLIPLQQNQSSNGTQHSNISQTSSLDSSPQTDDQFYQQQQLQSQQQQYQSQPYNQNSQYNQQQTFNYSLTQTQSQTFPLSSSLISPYTRDSPPTAGMRFDGFVLGNLQQKQRRGWIVSRSFPDNVFLDMRRLRDFQRDEAKVQIGSYVNFAVEVNMPNSSNFRAVDVVLGENDGQDGNTENVCQKTVSQTNIRAETKGICVFFTRAGFCQNMDRCNYAHITELQHKNNK